MQCSAMEMFWGGGPSAPLGDLRGQQEVGDRWFVVAVVVVAVVVVVGGGGGGGGVVVGIVGDGSVVSVLALALVLVDCYEALVCMMWLWMAI